MTAANPIGRRVLFRRQSCYSPALATGILLYAVTVSVSYTVLPALTQDLQAGASYASIATFFALGSLIGACLLSRSLRLLPTPLAYLSALLLFACCTLACAFAPDLPLLLAACLLQGLGGGLLVALSYTMLNAALPPALLARAIGLASAMWGVSALIGPYLGGRFENWRIPFLIIGAAGLVFCCIAFFIFRHFSIRPNRAQKQAAAPLLSIFMLAVLVVTISAGHITAGLCLLLLLIFIEKKAKNTLLPAGTFTFSSILWRLYGIIILNMLALGGARLYLPLFLQNLHQAGPISAGYISLADTIGWTIGVLGGAALNPARPDKGGNTRFSCRKNRAAAAIIFVYAPFAGFVSLGAAGLLVPVISGSLAVLMLIGLAIMLAGFFSGLFWPHILAGIMQKAGNQEQETAGSSLVIVQFFASALADCLAGAVVKASLIEAGNTASLAHAAAALFSYCLLLLLLVFFLCLNIRPNRRQQAPSAHNAPKA